jgi:hypothetical protein
MRSLWITATIVTAAIAVNGCKHRKEEPLPGPRSGATSAAGPTVEAGPATTAAGPDSATGQATPTSPPTAAGTPAAAPGPESRSGGREHHGGASGISWFQGTVEEAFSKTGAKGKVGFRF